MTVNTETSTASYTANGSTVAFPVPFYFLVDGDLKVTMKAIATGAETVLVLNSDYTVSGAGNQLGGAINFAAPPASGNQLFIERNVAAVQQTAYPENDKFPSASHEMALDRLTMLVQQLFARVGRALIKDPLSPTYDLANNTLINSGDAVGGHDVPNLAQVQAIATSVSTGIIPSQIATYAQLATSAGAALIGYLGFSGGAILRTVRAKLADFTNMADYTTVTQAAATSKTVRVLTAVNGAGTSLTNTAVADATFRGEGSLTNVYRKAVIPDNAASDDYPYQDLIAGKHLKKFNTAAKPVVVLVGDSISTYFANSVARSDMLVETLRDTLNLQMPNGVTFYDRSIAGMTLGSIFGTSLGTIPWATVPGKAWIDYVKDLAPDLVVFSFGMNDSTAVKVNEYINTLAYLNGWAKIPSIVFCTNLVPNVSSPTSGGGESEAEGRDMAAGLTRSFAKFNGLGLLDFHRKVCMVRDGFDPASSIMARGDTVAAVNNGAGGASISGTRLCRDFKVRINCTPSNLSASNYITVAYGNGVNDFVQILRPTGTTLRLSFFCGGSDSASIITQDITFNPSGGSYIAFTIEVSNDVFRLYQDADANVGQYNDPLLTQSIVRLGGQYTPKVVSNVQTILTAADFSYGEYRTNVPSVVNSLLWGDGSTAIDTHGGSGWNHPGGFVASHVYRPLIRGTNWNLPVAPSGSLSVAATGTSFTQTFETPELNTNYRITGSWEGSAAPAWCVLSKATNGFTISLAAAAGAPIKLNWRLER